MDFICFMYEFTNFCYYFPLSCSYCYSLFLFNEYSIFFYLSETIKYNLDWGELSRTPFACSIFFELPLLFVLSSDFCVKEFPQIIILANICRVFTICQTLHVGFRKVNKTKF